MSKSSMTSNRLHLTLVHAALLLVAAGPVLAGEPTQDDGAFPFESDFILPGQLPAEDGSVEDRIAAIKATLAEMSSAEGDRVKRTSQWAFRSAVVDLSTLWEPEDAVTAAYDLTGLAPSYQLYEKVAIALLSAARLARFDEDPERAMRHLATAAYVFDLADQRVKAEGLETSKMGLIHRAMVHLEEILITDSEDRWPQAVALLSEQLRRSSEGTAARWAQRILDDPARYVGERAVSTGSKHHVNGDMEAPAKVFAPLPRYTEAARQARVQGVVILQAIIDRQGTIAGVKILKGLSWGLSEEAVRAISTWLFEPATLGGEPVSVYWNLTVNFRLE